MRDWTNTSGQIIQAEIISVQGVKVQLKLANGLDTLYPMAKLSKADQGFIAEYLSSNKSSLIEADWNRPWPAAARVNPDDNNIQLVSEDADNGLYIYETTHFTFTSDVKLAISALRNFSRIFEATYAYAAATPFFQELDKLTANKIPIEVYNYKADYLKNGGLVGSAGVYSFRGDKGVIKVCFDYLGVKRIGKQISFDYQGDSTTLPHEIIHALTDRAYYHKHMKWFTEGIAEYMSNSYYANNIGEYRISESKAKRIIVPSITKYGVDGKGGKNLGTTISIPSVFDFMTQDTFFSSTKPELTSRNYGVAWLLAYYYVHIYEEGSMVSLKQLLKALKTTKISHKDPNAVAELIEEHLLGEQSKEELNTDFAKAMKRLGITIDYTK